MSDQWTDRLSEYLDDELAPDERAALEAHLRQCAACGAVLADLKRIVTRARGLEDRLPDHDLWPGIAAGIGVGSGEVPAIDLAAGRARRRWSFSPPQLIAAGLALMALSGGTAWLLHPTVAPAVAVRQAQPTMPVVTVGSSEASVRARVAGQSYAAAVSDLERVLEQNRGRLDSTTVRVIERNLATIDSAIAQAQRALAADSSSVYLNSHLAETRQRKLELLRQAAALVSSAS
ncbi:MAG TPA: zf-HC2 domain-containing protein [Gemmatimonadales bacterium]|nr:zf-HC2 domain-containing protein [Gemmatimonadales bacterium]